MTAFPLTRADALQRLADFLPQAGSAYARLRNLDRGPGAHDHVSRLSWALRRRVISEEEVARAVIGAHGVKAAEKFLSEILWRTYWKGWLESRPSVWTGYLAAVKGKARPRGYEAAVEGRTGIDAFDGWMAELRATGYLHNWARMQFASIWIFTLGLPWELGAELTLGAFGDGDPASNTLSWRWVAGLHTAGKSYLASGDRIREMTGGRFAPKGLARVAQIPRDSLTVPAAGDPRTPLAPRAVDSLLLVTTEDLSLETLPEIQALPIRALACLAPETEADRIALEDAMARARAAWPGAEDLGALTPAKLAAQDLPQIVTGFAPVGPVAHRLAPLRSGAIPLAEHLRPWDARTWPHCRKGFFALKEQMPKLLSALEPAHG